MKIAFERPLNFYMEVLETDDHVPSMRVEVKIVVPQFQHKFQYEGSFWIACENWDAFTNTLRGSFDEDAILQDMNGYFKFSVHKNNRGQLLSWDFSKEDLGGGRAMKIAFSSKVDSDVLAKIRDEFLEFPSWW